MVMRMSKKEYIWIEVQIQGDGWYVDRIKSRLNEVNNKVFETTQAYKTTANTKKKNKKKL